MISVLSTGMLYLFVTAVLLTFGFNLYKGAAYKNLTGHFDWASVKMFAGILFPFLVLLGLAQYLKIGAGDSLRYLAVGFVVPLLISKFNLPARSCGALLLALTVVLTWLFKDAAIAPVCFSLIAGMITWKLADNLLGQADGTYEDILPSLIWLVGLNWLRVAVPEAKFLLDQGLLLGSLSVTLMLSVFQSPFLTDDKVYLKRIILASTGGLGFLIVITKLLLAPNVDLLALLFGLALFAAYFLDKMAAEKDSKDYKVTDAVTVLVVVGIITLLASRLFGNFGLLIMAPAMLVASKESFGNVAALFFIARVFIQGYIFGFIANVTGVNLTHAYTGAALYAGFLLPTILSVVLRDVADKRWLVTLFLASGALIPLFSNYFLHEEPTGSLLVSSLVGAVLLAALAPCLYRHRQINMVQNNLLLVPIQMTAFALLGSELVFLGNTGIVGDKIKVLVIATIAVMIFSAVLYFLFSRSKGKQIEVSGN